MELGMTFNQAQYEAVIEEITKGLGTLGTKIAQISPAVAAATSGSWIPQMAIDGLVWCARQISDLATKLLETIKDIAEGAVAPIFFFIKAYGWHDTIGGPSSEVAATVAPNTLRACYTWSGPAATAYSKAIATQTTAAAKIQGISSSVATTLTVVAGAGLAFYVAIGILLAKIIAQVVASIVAIGTGWLSWAGLALIAESIVVDGTMIAAAVAAIVAFVGAQATALIGLKGQTEANESFPGGHWPVGTA